MNAKIAKKLRHYVREMNCSPGVLDRDKFGTMRYPIGTAQRVYHNMKRQYKTRSWCHG